MDIKSKSNCCAAYINGNNKFGRFHMDKLLSDVFSVFETGDNAADFQPITAGHINHTYAVYVSGEENPKYVLQKTIREFLKNPTSSSPISRAYALTSGARLRSAAGIRCGRH